MHRVAFLCSLVIAVQVHAQPSPPRFIVHTVDGPLAPAPLVHMADDFTLKAGAEVAGKDLASIRQVAKALPRFLTQNVLLLNNGDRVPVDVKAGVRLDQDRLYFRPGSPLQTEKELDLSLNYAAALCLGQSDADSLEDRELLLTRLLRESRARDVILLTDGDRVEGTFKGLDADKGATLNVNGQETLIASARIKAIAFSTEFKARPRTKKAFAQVVLSGGGRLGFGKLRLEAGGSNLTGVTLFGSTVVVPLAAVCAIDIRQGPAEYLSDLPGSFRAHRLPGPGLAADAGCKFGGHATATGPGLLRKRARHAQPVQGDLSPRRQIPLVRSGRRPR